MRLDHSYYLIGTAIIIVTLSLFVFQFRDYYQVNRGKKSVVIDSAVKELCESTGGAYSPCPPCPTPGRCMPCPSCVCPDEIFFHPVEGCIDSQMIDNQAIKEIAVLKQHTICQRDDDCVIIKTQCSETSCGLPVNRAYVEHYDGLLDETCEGYTDERVISLCSMRIPKCVNNNCTIDY